MNVEAGIAAVDMGAGSVLAEVASAMVLVAVLPETD